MATLGHYPMTIDEMGEWAKRMTHLEVHECALLLQQLGRPTITIRRAP